MADSCFLYLVTEAVPGELEEGSSRPGGQQATNRECSHRLCQTVQGLHLHQPGGPLRHLPPGAVHRGEPQGQINETLCRPLGAREHYSSGVWVLCSSFQSWSKIDSPFYIEHFYLQRPER